MREFRFNATAFLVVMASGTTATLLGMPTAASSPAAHYQPTWASLDQRPIPPWFQQAKFGVYIHWTLAAVPSWGKHSTFYWPNLLKSRQMEAAGPRSPKNDIDEEYVGLWRFHLSRYGADFKFEDFAPLWRAEAFNPEQWADLFVRSGAKYVVLTAKHHDGSCLWPSSHANKSWKRSWNAMDIGPRQDLVGALTRAVRQRGLKMGHYYSFFEWFNPLWLKDRRRFVSEVMQPQLRELIVRYQPDLLWTDGEWDAGVDLWQSREFLAWLFNDSPARDIVINDRWGQGCRHRHGGYYTTEFTPGMKDGTHAWEENRTVTRPLAYDAQDRPLWYSWVHNRQLTLANYYSARELILTLVDTVSRGGNLLLNIGPMADGRIPVIEEERLVEIGNWLKVNGEAIYGTHPWRRSCQWSSGQQPRIPYDQEWRVKYEVDALTAKPGGAAAVVEAFFTASDKQGGTLYAVVPWWPTRPLLLKDLSLAPDATVTLLGLKEKLQWRAVGSDIRVEVPPVAMDRLPCRHAFVLKLSHLNQ